MSDGVRTAWKVVGTVFAVPVLLVGVAQVVSALAHEERVEVTEVAAAGLDSVEVDNDAGAVRVIGVAGADSVTVTAQVSDGLWDSDHATRREGDRLVVDSSCPLVAATWCGVDHTIEVPEDMAVRVRASGAVRVDDLAGPLDVSSPAGRVELVGVGGDVTVSAPAGGVEATGLVALRVDVAARRGAVRLAFSRPPQRVSASADQGSVEIVVPDDPEVSYAVQATTDLGAVTTPVRTDPTSDRSIVAESDLGSVTIRYGGA